MSRDIDLSKELSDAEVQYLIDRERWDDLDANAEALGNDPIPRGTNPVSPQAQSASLGAQTAQQVPDGANPAPASLGQRQAREGNLGVSYESDDRPYEDWSKSELQEQAERRGLPKSGNKQELADSLRDWDEENDEGDVPVGDADVTTVAEPSPDNPDDAYDGVGADDGDPDED